MLEWNGPAVYCIGKSASVDCLNRVKKGGGYLERLKVRTERTNGTYTTLNVPCGCQAQAQENLAGIHTYARTGNCFGCVASNKCSSKNPLSISSYAANTIGKNLLEIEYMIDRTNRQDAIMDTSNKVHRLIKPPARHDSEKAGKVKADYEARGEPARIQAATSRHRRTRMSTSRSETMTMTHLTPATFELVVGLIPGLDDLRGLLERMLQMASSSEEAKGPDLRR